MLICLIVVFFAQVLLEGGLLYLKGKNFFFAHLWWGEMAGISLFAKDIFVI